MVAMNVFQSDAFSTFSLTAEVNKMPFVPQRLSQMGIFEEQGIRTISIGIEEKDGILELIPNTPRGGPPAQARKSKRKLRQLTVPHFPKEDTLTADEIAGIRAFGSETELQATQTEVNQRLGALMADHDATLEYGRIGAVKGTILDADGVTPLIDLFSEFGVTQTVVDFQLDVAATSVRQKAASVIREVENELGAATFTSLTALCGDTFWDTLIEHDDVKKAFDRWQNGEQFRQDPRTPFTFAGIDWERYRGQVGSTKFVADGDVHFVPRGVNRLFISRFAPADFMETVNTLGVPRYAKQAVDWRLQQFVDLHTQSNPISICVRPKVLVRGTLT